MPEGDTIHRAADRLRSALEGRELVRFEALRAGRPAPRPGTRIEAVEARGKHLLIRFADGKVLQTHMRMTGSWHLYRTGERWRKPAGAVRAVVAVDGWEAVCFAAPVVRLLHESAAEHALGHLGPDLCQADADIDEAAARLQRMGPGTTIAEALLDQRVAAGIGNVFKSEALFACGQHPFTPAVDLDPVTGRRLLVTASRQLRANLATTRRTTAPGGVAVYDRAGRPCPRCGTPVAGRRHGSPPRATYWCPSCQPSPET